MAKAADEGQALQHMTRQHGRNQLSGQFDGWTRTKHKALVDLHRRWRKPRAMHVLECGMGEMAHMAGWPGFVRGLVAANPQAGVAYTGVDFVPGVVKAAQEQWPQHSYHCAPFSQVPELFEDEIWDVVVLLDVLYHIPEQRVHDNLVAYALGHADKYVLWSFATDPSQVFNGGQNPGDAGFCWFPRPRPQTPDHWKVVASWDADTMQKQRMELLERID